MHRVNSLSHCGQSATGFNSCLQVISSTFLPFSDLHPLSDFKTFPTVVVQCTCLFSCTVHGLFSPITRKMQPVFEKNRGEKEEKREGRERVREEREGEGGM